MSLSAEGSLRARAGMPWSIGAYLVVNAVPDLRLVMDGPDCCFFRTELLQGNHDLRSTLLDVSGVHRVVGTVADVDALVLDRSDAIRAALRNARAAPETAAVLLGALPMAYLTGVAYEPLAAALAAAEPGPPVWALPTRSLQTDWHGGWSDALDALAAGLEPGDRPRRPDTVAIVGYLMDRLEEDHGANLRELRRLLGAIGLEVASVWLSGAPLGSLAAAFEAEVVVSLPHGRAAARRIAARSGARLVEAALPVGLDATERWLRAVAGATGREDAAEALLRRELDRVVPRVEWIAAHEVPGRRLVAVLDPHVAPGLIQIWEELGGEVVALWWTARGGPETPRPAALQSSDVVDIALLDRSMATLMPEGVDLALGNAFTLDVFRRHGAPFLEVGLPCHTEHALHSRPTLGFEGWLHLVEQLVNRMRLFAAIRR